MRTRSTLTRRMLVGSAGAMLALVLAAPAAFAEGNLVTADGDFVPDGADADVTLTYTVTATEEAVDAIPVTGLAFGDATISDVTAETADGQPMDVQLEEGARSTTIELIPPEPIQPDEELVFTLSYRTIAAVTARDDETDVIEIPVLAVTWAPQEASPGTFTGRLVLPEGERYSEGFPSVPSSIDTEGDNEVVNYDMIVMPSLMRAVATVGSPPFFSYQRTLEIGAIALTLVGAAGLYFVLVVQPRRRPADGPVEDRGPAGSPPDGREETVT